MTHMDAYTILYQAKEHMTGENYIEQLVREASGACMTDFAQEIEDRPQVVRQIATTELEAGINIIRCEFPPNVSKRMQKYYQQNKEALIETFTHRVREMILRYDNHGMLYDQKELVGL